MARDILPEIPVAEARTPLEPSSNVAGGLLQVAGAGLEVAKQGMRIKSEQAEIDYRVAKSEQEAREKQQIAAKELLEERMRSFGQAEGERFSDRITNEALTLLSEDEERVSKLTTDSATRLKRRYDQGMLTEEALKLEYEVEMRKLRNSTGGAYGDIIAKGFAEVVGFDPSGSKLKHVASLLKQRGEEGGGDPTHASLKKQYGQDMGNKIYQYMIATGVPEEAAVSELAAFTVNEMQLQVEQNKVARQDLKGAALQRSTVSLAHRTVALKVDELRTGGFVSKLEQAVAKGQRVDSSFALAEIELVKQRIISETMDNALSLLDGTSIPTTLDAEVEEAVDKRLEPYRNMAASLDKFDSMGKGIKYLKEAGAMYSYRADPFLPVLQNFPPEVQAQYLIDPKAALTNWHLQGVHDSSKPAMAALIYAEVTGAPEYKDLMQNFPDALAGVEALKEQTGKTSEELYNEQVVPSILSKAVANTTATPESRVDSLRKLQEVSPRQVISMMGAPKNFNGIAANEEVRTLVQYSMADVLAGYTSVAQAMPISIPTEKFESDYVTVRQEMLDVNKMHTKMTLREAISQGLVRFESTGVDPSGKFRHMKGIEGDVKLVLTQQVVDKVGDRNARWQEKLYQNLIPTYMKDMAKALHSNKSSGLLKGQEIDTVEKMNEYLNKSFVDMQGFDQPEAEATVPTTDSGGDWGVGQERDYGGVTVKRAK